MKQKKWNRLLRQIAASLIAAALVLSPAAASDAEAAVMSASDITRDEFIDAVASVAKTARIKRYRYGNSTAAVPTSDKVISCDRMVAKALWDLGFTDQPKGGITIGSMTDYLTAHGFKMTTTFSSIGYGSIVLVKHADWKWRVHTPEGFTHTFVTVGFDEDSMTCTKYDCGADSLIQSVQPFEGCSWNYTDEIRVFNIPKRTSGSPGTSAEAGTGKTVHVRSVRLDTGSAVMVTGQKFDLGVRVLPSDSTDPTVRWTSSDPAVATVNSKGTVRTLSPGTVRITAQARDGGARAVCKVTVMETPVEKLKLNRTSLTLRKKRTYRLKVTVLPASATNRDVIWKSSKPKVVSVNKNGRLKARRKGKAVITVISKSGRKKAKCKVTVK